MAVVSVTLIDYGASVAFAEQLLGASLAGFVRAGRVPCQSYVTIISTAGAFACAHVQSRTLGDPGCVCACTRVGHPGGAPGTPPRTKDRGCQGTT